ncbi:MAG: hypothetical protein IPL67_00980 [Ignavibacteria bacterium]|nr:hypothetical protein [Ignavibacteria bacterium]
MSHYLSDIAARSVPDSGLSPLAPTPAWNIADAGMVQDHAAETNIGDNAEQDQFVQQNIVPQKPVQVQPIKTPGIISRIESPTAEENIVSSYFSTHAKRLVKLVSEKPGKNKHPREEAGKRSIDVVITDEVLSLEKQMIAPSVKDKEEKKNTLQPKSDSGIEQLTPNHSGIVNKAAVNNNKTNQPTPKLVIGKITVEILPPVTPTPQKIFTRVVQSASKDSHSRSNKLIFGLGQL